MRRFAVALAGSVLTAGYWWLVFVSVYAGALFAGDRDPVRPPASDGATMTRSVVIIAAAVLLYAAASLGWRRLTRGAARVDS